MTKITPYSNEDTGTEGFGMKRRLIIVAITTAWLIAAGMALIFGSLTRIVLFVYFRGIWPVLDWWRYGRHHGRLFSEIWKRP